MEDYNLSIVKTGQIVPKILNLATLARSIKDFLESTHLYF